MGDHFALLVDRLLTESTLEAAIESRNRLMQATANETKIVISSQKVDSRDDSSPKKMVECRICQDEDEDCNMETPCSCCGSLKYAHRRCVPRWCNEKGNTICEICHQHFTPGYTAPPPLFQIGGIPMNLRGNWQTSGRDLHGPQFIAMVSTDRNFLNPEYEEYSASTRNSNCCRSVAIAFMVLLILRHILPVILRTNEVSFPLLMLLFLRIAGILLPVYVIMRAVTALQRRLHQQGASGVGLGNFEEIGPLDVNLKPRNSTWLRMADLLFVDNPVGTGFSFVEESNLFVKTDEEAATDLTTLLKEIFNRNESLQQSPLHIVAESYGGKFAVTLGLSALKAIGAGKLKAKLGGVILGDTWISPEDFVLSWGPLLFWYSGPKKCRRSFNFGGNLQRRAQPLAPFKATIFFRLEPTQFKYSRSSSHCEPCYYCNS
ncbi:uncharacterized protein LOC122721890 isoform X2 [Manihot esculenta]|uniref:Uncharacterized protein n=3 Tax=Manihot esculenta TaxID=3983 RepID=A0ACB7GC88_MANES|nr:uncharacterized protein LOC122721886 isoform X2 [Manihot esculenta]XP_043806846.1 uncharacterized protein LOC122721890 isoform X2 [Manihot esculenta]KAG8637696.1 hypothetical protein MANES_15G154550v8 [Manihot esculenta]KAG8637922.1 hypothetical protein MANES_15G176652v8 [Manihot esculenta]